MQSIEQDRQWSYRYDGIINPKNQEHDFKIMSYNVLADTFTGEGYEYFPESLIPILNYLHGRIVEEVMSVEPDIVCLQEVTEPHFEKALKPDLQDNGFTGERMTYKFKGKADGLAIFFRPSVFRLVASKPCSSQDLINAALQKTNISKKDRKTIEKFAERCQGCFVAKFEHLATGRFITVGNMHTKWSEFKLPALSCFETSLAVQEVKKLAAGQAYIITGDFNSTPDTPTYHMLSTGTFDETKDIWSKLPDFRLYEWNGKASSDPATAQVVQSKELFKTHQGSARITADMVSADKLVAKCTAGIIRNCSTLSSAYLEVTDQEPQVTNIEGSSWPGFIHELCLDYIWFSNSHLVAQGVLETPSSAQCRSQHGLPNMTLPSDHVSVAAVFQFI